MKKVLRYVACVSVGQTIGRIFLEFEVPLEGRWILVAFVLALVATYLTMSATDALWEWLNREARRRD